MTYYHEGWAAFVNGLGEEDCPYTDSLKRGEWLAGWQTASRKLKAS
jgi:ribosome modulation factor